MEKIDIYFEWLHKRKFVSIDLFDSVTRELLRIQTLSLVTMIGLLKWFLEEYKINICFYILSLVFIALSIISSFSGIFPIKKEVEIAEETISEFVDDIIKRKKNLLILSICLFLIGLVFFISSLFPNKI